MHPSGNTADFTAAVYRAVSQIPRGRVLTYGQIAHRCGKPRGARQVGKILCSVPAGSNLPCHRVVRADGVLAPDAVFGSHHLQRDLLMQEGVPFTASGRIDFKRLHPTGTQADQADKEEKGTAS